MGQACSPSIYHPFVGQLLLIVTTLLIVTIIANNIIIVILTTLVTIFINIDISMSKLNVTLNIHFNLGFALNFSKRRVCCHLFLTPPSKHSHTQTWTKCLKFGVKLQCSFGFCMQIWQIMTFFVFYGLTQHSQKHFVCWLVTTVFCNFCKTSLYLYFEWMQWCLYLVQSWMNTFYWLGFHLRIDNLQYANELFSLITFINCII